jgi:hypothetical protein
LTRSPAASPPTPGIWLIITACLFILLGLFAIIEPAWGRWR